MTSSHFNLNCPPLYLDFFPAFYFHSPYPSYCTLMTSYFKHQRITAHPRLAWGFFLCKRAVTHPHCSHMPALTLWRRLNGTDQLHLKKTLDPITVIGWARHRQNQIVQNYISEENSPEALSNGEGDTLIRGKIALPNWREHARLATTAFCENWLLQKPPPHESQGWVI